MDSDIFDSEYNSIPGAFVWGAAQTLNHILSFCGCPKGWLAMVLLQW